MNTFVYLLIILVPLALIAALTMVVRRNRQDLKYRDEAARRREQDGQIKG